MKATEKALTVLEAAGKTVASAQHLCDPGAYSRANAERTIYALHFADQFTAVTRAIFNRPWETRFPGMTPLCRVCGLRTPHDPGATVTPHADWCQMIAVDAALDAVEAAAKEVVP